MCGKLTLEYSKNGRAEFEADTLDILNVEAGIVNVEVYGGRLLFMDDMLMLAAAIVAVEISMVLTVLACNLKALLIFIAFISSEVPAKQGNADQFELYKSPAMK